ncbi:MAG: hypothetical protein FVQ80_15030 [Planctomycetes bacterium]|nr:hypothetical protein [Planctomycetota bacterium]
MNIEYVGSAKEPPHPGAHWKLIKNDKIIDLGPDPVIPGKTIATARSQEYVVTVYRLGDRYYKRVVYLNLAALVKNIHDTPGKWQLNRGEWFYLQDLASKKSGKKEAPIQPVIEKTEEEKSRAAKYGHRWKISEFKREHPHVIAEGAKLIAYNSYVIYDDPCYWRHEALFSLDQYDKKGQRQFCEVSASEKYGSYSPDLITMKQAQRLYEKMDHHLSPMEPAPCSQAPG